MKRYIGRNETITAERYVELGWPREQAEVMVKEGQTESRVFVLDEDTMTEEPLDQNEAEKRKSPDGFAWGYGGSGPTALAYAILRDVLGHDAEPDQAIRFRQTYIESAPNEGFSIDEGTIREFLGVVASI